MHCKGCGNKEAYALRWVVVDGKTVERCNECSDRQISGGGDFAWKHKQDIISEKVTKNLNRSKHVYVPPINEQSVGGIFDKR